MSEAEKINPPHYLCGNVDSIDHIRAVLTEEEFKGYLKGCLLKYLIRAGRKDSELAETDYSKAAWFRERINFFFGKDAQNRN